MAEILTQMFAFGLFDNPATGSLSTTVTSAAHQQTALQLGEEGTVLLKNNGLLPLNPNMHRVDRGDRHRRRRRGRARRRRQRRGRQLEHGLADHRHPERGRAERQRHLHRRATTTAPPTSRQAVAAAQAATDAIIYVNLPEGEESDLTSLDLSSADETMIARRGRGQPEHDRGDQQRRRRWSCRG